jgi:hypothetical protein
MTAKPRRKRYPVRIVRVEFIDVEVLAANEDEAADIADRLGNAAYTVGSEYLMDSECYILIGATFGNTLTIPDFKPEPGIPPHDDDLDYMDHCRRLDKARGGNRFI